MIATSQSLHAGCAFGGHSNDHKVPGVYYALVRCIVHHSKRNYKDRLLTNMKLKQFLYFRPWWQLYGVYALPHTSLLVNVYGIYRSAAKRLKSLIPYIYEQPSTIA